MVRFFSLLFFVFFLAESANNSNTTIVSEISDTSRVEVKKIIASVKGKKLKWLKNIGKNISPKSIVYCKPGMFFAQNMMYRHNVTVYNENGKLINTITDEVDFSKFGIEGHKGKIKGSPVEAAMTTDGQYAWVSNYQMYGNGFSNPGKDNCSMRKDYDPGYLYRVNTNGMHIDQVVEVGCIPKYVAVSPNNHLVLVSNWCSGDLSVVDSFLGKEIKRIDLGRFPRGIVVDNKGEFAYVAVMGTGKVAKIALQDLSVSWLGYVGKGPRHLCISPDDRYLYISLNGEGMIAKFDLEKELIVKKTRTGRAPRSMALHPDGNNLYVVNYFANSLSKVRTIDFKEIEEVDTGDKPIGVAVDPINNRVWVACYSGIIQIFDDSGIAQLLADGENLKNNWGTKNDFVFNFSADLNQYFQAKVNLDPIKNLKEQNIENTETSVAEINIDTKELKVEIKEKTEIIQTPSKAVIPTNSKGFFFLISGSFMEIKNATSALETLKKQGYLNAEIMPMDEGIYRVAFGKFNTKLEANEWQKQIIANGFSDAWILHH